MVSIARLATSQAFLSPIPIISYVTLQCCILIAVFSETEMNLNISQAPAVIFSTATVIKYSAITNK